MVPNLGEFLNHGAETPRRRALGALVGPFDPAVTALPGSGYAGAFQSTLVGARQNAAAASAGGSEAGGEWRVCDGEASSTFYAVARAELATVSLCQSYSSADCCGRPSDRCGCDARGQTRSGGSGRKGPGPRPALCPVRSQRDRAGQRLVTHGRSRDRVHVQIHRLSQDAGMFLQRDTWQA